MAETLPNTRGETPVPAPDVQPPQVETPENPVIHNTMKALRELRESVSRKADEMELDQLLDSATEHLTEAQASVASASTEVMTQLQTELDQLPQTLAALPEAVKTQSQEKISKIQSLASTILTSVKSATATAWNGVKDGIGWTFEKIANGAAKVGEFFNEIWMQIKPHLGKIAGVPGLKFILGEETMKALQEWSGYNPAAEKLKEEITSRLPDDVIFEFSETNQKKEVTAITDKYNALLRAKNLTASAYDQGTFIAEMIAGNHLTFENLPVDKNGEKKILILSRVLEAADKMIAVAQEEAKKKAAAPAAPAAPAPTPAPAPTTPVA